MPHRGIHCDIQEDCKRNRSRKTRNSQSPLRLDNDWSRTISCVPLPREHRDSQEKKTRLAHYQFGCKFRMVCRRCTCGIPCVLLNPRNAPGGSRSQQIFRTCGTSKTGLRCWGFVHVVGWVGREAGWGTPPTRRNRHLTILKPHIQRETVPMPFRVRGLRCDPGTHTLFAVWHFRIRFGDHASTKATMPVLQIRTRMPP